MEYKVFGCKVNKYYTDKWLNSNYLRDKQGIFIASCVVTDQAKRKWIKFVKDIFKNSDLIDSPLKNGKVYISGCGAFKEGRAQEDFFELYPELGNYKGLIEVLGEDPEERSLNGKMEIKKFDLSSLKNKIKNTEIYTKKFVLIQGGCDSFCSFCLTVQKRGRHYFRSKQDIAEEINEFEKNGGKEVVLTGVNLSAWGLDTTNPEKAIKSPLSSIDQVESNFSILIDYLLKHTKIPRLRISSMGPEFIDKKCLKLFENTRIYPHFHFSIQSGSTNVLKNMKRHYDGGFMKKLLLYLRNIKRSDNVKIGIGADIIVGFPGESDSDFLDSINLIKDCKITKVHAFPFSAHKFGENVPAGFFKDQIQDNIKKQRMFDLMSLSEEVRDEFIDENIGSELEVLIENVNNEGKWKGWTQNYLEADSNNFKVISGNISKNQIVKGILLK